MTCLVKSKVSFECGPGGTTGLISGAFAGLDRADRQSLSRWLGNAHGIETVIDLGARPWNIPGAGDIFGVFETSNDQASWLIVRCETGWVVARRKDGFISDVVETLSDILVLIDRQCLI